MATKFRPQNKPKMYKFQFLAKRGFFRMHSRVYRVGNSNMLPEFSREQRELPWQPNTGKKTKLHRVQLCTRNLGICRINSQVFGAGEFKYAVQNFKEVRGVAMATECEQK